MATNTKTFESPASAEQPSAGPRDQVRRPTIWLSHESAASLHGFGVYLADTPSFITLDRLQPRKGVKVYRRSNGLERHEYTVIDRFAVTAIARTAADLARSKSDWGHLGRFIDEQIRAQAVTLAEVAEAMKLSTSEVESMIAMDSQPTSR